MFDSKELDEVTGCLLNVVIVITLLMLVSVPLAVWKVLELIGVLT